MLTESSRWLHRNGSHWRVLRAGMPTSIQAARHGVTFAGGAFKVRGWTIYQRTGSSCLGLRSAAIAKLGTQGKEFLWRCFWKQQSKDIKEKNTRKNSESNIENANLLLYSER